MKIAITSTGNTLNAAMDKRFGRCSWFVIYDTELQSIEFIPNLNNQNIEGAGMAAVDLIALRNVKKVISGEFGAKVKEQFDRLQIQLIIIPDTTKTIQSILEFLTPKNN